LIALEVNNYTVSHKNEPAVVTDFDNFW